MISLSRAALTLIPRNTVFPRITVCPPEVTFRPETTYSRMAQFPMPFISIFLQATEELPCAVTVELARLSTLELSM